MTTHKLKILTEYYDAVADGSKRFELREDDRGFKAGDTLHLHEWAPMPHGHYFTGRELTCTVTYILNPLWTLLNTGVVPGAVVMSIAEVEQVAP